MKTDDITGQWFGTTHFDNSTDKDQSSSLLVLNIERRSPATAQIAEIQRSSNPLRLMADATINISGDTVSGTAQNYLLYDHSVQNLVSLEGFYKKMNVNKEPLKRTDFTGEFDGSKITGRFTNNINTPGSFTLWRTFSEAAYSQPPPTPRAKPPMSWDQFKSYVGKFRSKGNVVFRGQTSNTFPLKTTFHRQHRNRLPLYMSQDVWRLRHHINAISPYFYQTGNEDLYGLLSLAQHHGFPTPLLDWTESPYVAAFFAFDCLSERSTWSARANREPVRVFAFHLERWNSTSSKRVLANSLNDPCPDFQFFHPSAHNNPRYYPQQSMAAFSSVENIEDFVTAYELEHKKTFLTRIDILASEREVVEDDLRFMGITPATLFPGFEGICKSLRSLLFDGG